MIVDIEFFDEEPLENIITCMNYMVDKVIFFGNCDMMHEKRQCMERFLKDSCGVQEVDYHVIQPETTEDALAVLRRVIDCELEQKNEVYFDITGGEDVILVAFGILASEYELPMHKFDVVHNRLIEMNRDAERCLSKNVPANHASLDLEQMIKLQGGVINESLHKELKKTDGGISEDEILSIWKVAKNNWGIWNAFSAFLRETINGDELSVCMTAATVIDWLKNSKTILKTPRQLNKMLDDFAKEKVLLDVMHQNGKYCFRFKSREIMECLRDGGSILELYTYQREKTAYNECKIGVHLDWDGHIHTSTGEDVLNEVDVLKLEGNIVTFISCKTGKMAPQTALHALYELETVASRFGGKYAKKKLVIVNPLSETCLERAKEMGIEVVMEGTRNI